MTAERADTCSAGRRNIVGMSREALREALIAAGTQRDKSLMRVAQIWQWVYQKGERDFGRMTNLSKDYRRQLADSFEIGVPRPTQRRISADGTRKYLLRLKDGNEVEAVYIPDEDRGTLCVSSQVGCTLNLLLLPHRHAGAGAQP